MLSRGNLINFIGMIDHSSMPRIEKDALMRKSMILIFKDGFNPNSSTYVDESGHRVRAMKSMLDFNYDFESLKKAVDYAVENGFESRANNYYGLFEARTIDQINIYSDHPEDGHRYIFESPVTNARVICEIGHKFENDSCYYKLSFDLGMLHSEYTGVVDSTSSMRYLDELSNARWVATKIFTMDQNMELVDWNLNGEKYLKLAFEKESLTLQEINKGIMIEQKPDRSAVAESVLNVSEGNSDNQCQL